MLTFMCGEPFSPATSTHASSCYADAMPNSGMHQLPSCLTKASVYFLYREEADSKKQPYLSKSCFLYNMWTVQFPDVVIPKVSFDGV